MSNISIEEFALSLFYSGIIDMVDYIRLLYLLDTCNEKKDLEPEIVDMINRNYEKLLLKL